MKTITGIDALRMAQDVSKLNGGTFVVSFYKYNRTKNVSSNVLTTMDGCTYRSQMPKDKLSVDGDNYFLFNDKEGKSKQCFRILLRYIGFPPNFELRKVEWL